MAKLMLTALLMLAFGMGTVAKAQIGSPTTTLPSEVVDLLSRRAACLEWLSKCQKNPGSSADYESEMSALGCEAIPGEQLSLKRQYANEPNVLVALDQTWIKIVRRVPVGPMPEELDHDAPR